MQVMIHAVPSRMWYVREYLVPMLEEQHADDVVVYCDSEKDGNLKAWLKSVLLCGDEGNTWHLQDDVIISHDFVNVAQQYEKKQGIVCGFKSVYDGDNPSGRVSTQQMWFSFPCIRIPNKIVKECSVWCSTYMIGNPVYREYWQGGVNDDYMFRRYVLDYYKDEPVYNLAPNIVDHIDYLIGGTVNSNSRIRVIRSKLWEDEYLVEELSKKLRTRHVVQIENIEE